jgi:hypothetical protein
VVQPPPAPAHAPPDREEGPAPDPHPRQPGPGRDLQRLGAPHPPQPARRHGHPRLHRPHRPSRECGDDRVPAHPAQALRPRPARHARRLRDRRRPALLPASRARSPSTS